MEKNYLFTISYKDFRLWDVKRYSKNAIKSHFEVSLLGHHINQENKKIELSDFPDKMFHILGISNEAGMFDAYSDKGVNFNQPYKVVNNGYIAYNPYRVNVGSIGIKTENLKGNLISPAYVVFSCKETLLPEFLFVLMKTSWFNDQVKENTSGSVRQNLTFDALSNIKIPVPSIEEQKELLSRYNEKILLVELMKDEISYFDVERFIENRIKLSETCSGVSNTMLNFTNYASLNTWDVRNRSNKQILQTSQYNIKPLKLVAEINPSLSKRLDDNDDVSFIPMECVSDLDGNIKEKRVCKASKKGLTKFENGDVIWAKITPCMQNGKSAVVYDLKNGVGYGSTEFYVIRTNKRVLMPEYLHYLLRMYRVREEAVNYFSGSAGQQRVRKSFLEELNIPLPSLEEQNSIVKQLDEIKNKIVLNRDTIENLYKQANQDFENAIFTK